MAYLSCSPAIFQSKVFRIIGYRPDFSLVRKCRSFAIGGTPKVEAAALHRLAFLIYNIEILLLRRMTGS